MASKYQSRSVAEQNSFDMSWELLMQERFTELRSTICRDNKELRRFRQLLINSVMATDLGDKQIKELRNARWEKAFAVSGHSSSADMTCSTDHSSSAFSENAEFTSMDAKKRDTVNRKATIVVSTERCIRSRTGYWSVLCNLSSRLGFPHCIFFRLST